MTDIEVLGWHTDVQKATTHLMLLEHYEMLSTVEARLAAAYVLWQLGELLSDRALEVEGVVEFAGVLAPYTDAGAFGLAVELRVVGTQAHHRLHRGLQQLVMVKGSSPEEVMERDWRDYFASLLDALGAQVNPP